MTIDLVIRNARLQGRSVLTDIAFANGVIAGIAESAAASFICDAPQDDAPKYDAPKTMPWAISSAAALPPADFAAIAENIAQAGIAVTVLPATDLFLTSRAATYLVPRGVAPAHRLASFGVLTTISTNNVLNPFTPFGDASLLRMANLYANVAQLRTEQALSGVFDMITVNAECLLGLNPAPPAIGGPPLSSSSMRRAPPPPSPAQTFDRPRPRILRDSAKA